MNKPTPPAIERQEVQRLALLSLLTALPVSAGATLVMEGDTVLWAGIERALGIQTINAQVTHSGTENWTNDPNASVTVSTPPPPPPPPPPPLPPAAPASTTTATGSKEEEEGIPCPTTYLQGLGCGLAYRVSPMYPYKDSAAGRNTDVSNRSSKHVYPNHGYPTQVVRQNGCYYQRPNPCDGDSGDSC